MFRLSLLGHAVRPVSWFTSASSSYPSLFPRKHLSTISLTHEPRPVIIDRIKVRRAMESSLQKTAMKIVAIVNKDKDHIPPITTSDQNPFPYRIAVNPKQTENVERGFGGWN